MSPRNRPLGDWPAGPGASRPAGDDRGGGHGGAVSRSPVYQSFVVRVRMERDEDAARAPEGAVRVEHVNENLVRFFNDLEKALHFIATTVQRWRPGA